jgi:hypothetical protein
MAGFPSEAVSMMTVLWRLAAADRGSIRDKDASEGTATRVLAAERDSSETEAKVLQTLNQELQRHRTTAEKSLADARALLTRREAALEEERSRAASLEQALVRARMELEVLLERRRLTPPRTAASMPRRKPKRRKRPAARTTKSKRKTAAKRVSPKQTGSTMPVNRAPRRDRPRNRRRKTWSG